jgi:hypothetical protein
VSITIPGFFQPVGWKNGLEDTDNRYLLLSGGFTDYAGLLGLTHTLQATPTSNTMAASSVRVINVAGKYRAHFNIYSRLTEIVSMGRA